MFRNNLPTTSSVASDGLHENDVDAKSQGLTKVDLLDEYDMYIMTPISRSFKYVYSLPSLSNAGKFEI